MFSQSHWKYRALRACVAIGSVAATTVGGPVGGMRLAADLQPSSTQTIVVDDDKKECPEATFTDLRLAAVAAQPGATILVCPGNYPGPVLVDKRLTFLAVRGAGSGNGHINNGDGQGESRERSDARNRSATDSKHEAIVMAGPLGDGFKLVLGSAQTVIDGFVITGGVQPIFHAGIDVIDPTGSGYRILNNLITNNNVGMYFHSTGVWPSRIEGNAFINNNAGNFPSPNTGTAIFTQLQPINDTLIQHNYFQGHSDSALNLGDGSLRGLVITGNTSVNDATLLVLGRATGSVVSDNTTTGTVNTALYLFGQNDSVRVLRNHLAGGAGNQSSGIRLTGPFFGAVGPNTNMTFADNRAEHFKWGIRASNVTMSRFDRNRLFYNSEDGIELTAGVAFVPAVGNTLTNNQAHHNLVLDCEDQTLNLNTWINNHGEKSFPTQICTKHSEDD